MEFLDGAVRTVGGESGNDKGNVGPPCEKGPDRAATAEGSMVGHHGELKITPTGSASGFSTYRRHPDSPKSLLPFQSKVQRRLDVVPVNAA